MSRNFELLTHPAASPSDCESAASPSITDAVTPMANLSEAASDQDISPLVNQLFLSRNSTGVRHVLFCGADQTSNSGQVCLRAASELAAQTTHTVCLIDVNGRSHASHPQPFPVAPASGSRTPADIQTACRQLARNLWRADGALLSAASRSLLSGEELVHELAAYHDAFDHVLINTPGVTASPVASILGPLVDGAVLVVQANRTRKIIARKAAEVLESSGARLLGTVLNDRTFPIPESLYKHL